MAAPLTRLTTPLAIGVFAALPTVGLVAGPSYAALVFGLAAVQLCVALAERRRMPPLDGTLALLAGAFAAWCWASVAWSADPARSAAAALQMSLILTGSLLVVAMPVPDEPQTDRLFRALLVATLAGAALFIADRACGYPLQTLLLPGDPHGWPATKYSRGIDHLVVIAWPQFGYWALRRDWRRLLLLAAAIVAVETMGWSLAGQIGAVAGMLVLGVTWTVPRAGAAAIGTGVTLFVATMPLSLRLLTDRRLEVAPYLKTSGLHRLEIWDFMTRRALERPLLGWGFGIAGQLPVPQDSHYRVLHDASIYPHNQWLGVWVEIGAPGALLALGFALLVLLRIARLARPVQPFAYAAFASAMAIACVNFEVKTDSWWAALAAGAWLLRVLDPPARGFALPMTRS